ncbi:MAG: alpha/beta hydrolase [Planctomycetota bacterium]
MPASPPRRLSLTSADGVSLAADEIAGGDPALVFLHGLASSRLSERSASLLEWAQRKHRRLVRLDFRGHGESAGTLATMTLSGLVADAEAALAHAGRAVLVGSSLGGMVAAWTATRAADRIAGLVLIAPAFGFLHRMRARPRRGDRIVIANSWIEVEIDEDVLVDAEAWPECDMARRIQVPTLIIHGTHDEVVPARESEQVFTDIACPRKELWLIEGGDHRLQPHAQPIWERVGRLLGDIETSATREA